MTRQWTTTYCGDRLDVGMALTVQRRFANGAGHGFTDRYLLDVVWGGAADLLAVFGTGSDCVRAYDLFTCRGWIPVEPEPGLQQARALNPARVRRCSAGEDVDGTWRVRLATDNQRFYTHASGLTGQRARQCVGELTKQMESGRSTSWVDPDFTQPSWQALAAGVLEGT